MAKNNIFRIAAGDFDSLQSSIWNLWIEKNDIYVMTREEKKVSKLSLHASGISRLAYLTEADINDPLIIDNDPRVIYKWKNAKNPSNQAWRRLDIIIPATPVKKPFVLHESLRPIGSITMLDLLPRGFKYELTLFVTEPQYNLQKLLIKGDKIFSIFTLQKGEIVSIRERKRKMEEFEQKDYETKANALHINYDKAPSNIFAAIKEIDQGTSHPLIINYTLGCENIFVKNG